MKQADRNSFRNTLVFGKTSVGKTTALPIDLKLKLKRKILVTDTKELVAKSKPIKNQIKRIIS